MVFFRELPDALDYPPPASLLEPGLILLSGRVILKNISVISSRNFPSMVGNSLDSYTYWSIREQFNLLYRSEDQEAVYTLILIGVLRSSLYSYTYRSLEKQFILLYSLEYEKQFILIYSSECEKQFILIYSSEC